MYYILDFFDLDCTMEIVEEGKKTYKCRLLFPDGSFCICLVKKHEFCVAKVVKCLENTEVFNAFVDKNKDFLCSQYKKRNRLDFYYHLFKGLLTFSYVFIMFVCVATNYFLILLAFFCLLVYNYCIYPRLSIEFTNRHLALIINKAKQYKE